MKTEMVFLDMDGTVYLPTVNATLNVAPSPWARIPQVLGPGAEALEELSKQKWNCGGFKGRYTAWVMESIENHQRHGLKRTQFQQIMDEAEFTPGIKEVIQELNARNRPSVIVSGGFKYHADRAQRQLGITHTFSACEYFWKGEDLAGWNVLPTDYANKVIIMQMMMREYGAQAKNCAFVGDGANDKYLAQEVGISISFNGAPELEEVCTHVIRQKKGEEDFRAVLEHIL